MRIARILQFMVLTAGVVVVAFPFVWMTTAAFKTLPEAAAPTLKLLPDTWQWQNLAETFRAAPFGRYFLNSFFVASVVTVCVVITSITAGFAFARVPFPGRGILFSIILATMMVPFEITLIPNYVLIQRFGWYNSYWALIVPWCANGFSVFLLRQAFLGLPNDFQDAAAIDGCGPFRFLAYIGAPLVKSATVTAALFAFLGSYNAFVWPLVVTHEEAMRPVQVGLTYFAGAEGTEVNLLMCASLVVMLPTVILYFLAQRRFMGRSLSAGLKG